jgi:hypothetical protein
MLGSVARGIDRLEAVMNRVDPNTVQALLTKLQVSSLGQIADIKTLQNVVLDSKNSLGRTDRTQLNNIPLAPHRSGEN